MITVTTRHKGYYRINRECIYVCVRVSNSVLKKYDDIGFIRFNETVFKMLPEFVNFRHYENRQWVPVTWELLNLKIYLWFLLLLQDITKDYYWRKIQSVSFNQIYFTFIIIYQYSIFVWVKIWLLSSYFLWLYCMSLNLNHKINFLFGKQKQKQQQEVAQISCCTCTISWFTKKCC